MVAWLCSQVEPGSLLSQKPPVLSQQILLPLIQQLGYDLLKVTAQHANDGGSLVCVHVSCCACGIHVVMSSAWTLC